MSNLFVPGIVEEQDEAPLNQAAPHPWHSDADLQGWEPDGSSDDQPRQPPRAAVLVQLDPDETAWRAQQAELAGTTLSDFVRQLIDGAKVGQTQAPS